MPCIHNWNIVTQPSHELKWNCNEKKRNSTKHTHTAYICIMKCIQAEMVWSNSKYQRLLSFIQTRLFEYFILIFLCFRIKIVLKLWKVFVEQTNNFKSMTYDSMQVLCYYSLCNFLCVVISFVLSSRCTTNVLNERSAHDQTMISRFKFNFEFD